MKQEPPKRLPKWVEWSTIIGLILYCSVALYFQKNHEPVVKELNFTRIGEIIKINQDQTITELRR